MLQVVVVYWQEHFMRILCSSTAITSSYGLMFRIARYGWYLTAMRTRQLLWTTILSLKMG